MKILIIGSGGMLGKDLVRVFQEGRHEIMAPSHAELDITREETTRRYIENAAPDWVLLCAAYTRVDDCETHRERAFSVNGDGPRHVAMGCRDAGAKLLFVSTDYVFDGAQPGAYTEEDSPCPINVYGESKLRGEINVRELAPQYVIVRTSALYGLNGKNFVDAILNKVRSGSPLKVVDDQQTSPTYTRDLAEGLTWLVAREASGIFNVTNGGSCSWFEFAEKIIQETGAGKVRLDPVSTEEFNAAAKRPMNSVLDFHRFQEFTGRKLRPWNAALISYLQARNMIPFS